MLRRTSFASIFASILASTAALGNPLCPVDITNDCVVDSGDLSVYITLFIAEDPAADLTGDGVVDSGDLSAFITGFIAGCGPYIDEDGDRLDTCQEIVLYGTDTRNPDTDGDGLGDGDETIGTTTGLDLAAMGANPRRFTIFVETDWFAGTFDGGQSRNFRPTPSMVSQIQSAFSGAPLTNHDGTTGVDIFIDYGQGGVFTSGNQLPGSPDFIQFDDDFNDYKDSHFAAARKGYFHYAIFGNRYNAAGNGSSGVAEINGDDFMVTTSSYFSNYNAATTFVHEIGHNLGLRHGGNENRNYKPNYNSVMNYRHQFPGADTNGDALGDGKIDYSNAANWNIDESAIDEWQGVDGVNPIDWNGNGIIDPAFSYALNINCSGGATTACGTGSGSCYDSSCDLLRDHSDWENINWSRLTNSSDEAVIERSECDNWPGK